MKQYFITVTGRGYLKNIKAAYHNGNFTKQENLAAGFDDKADAEDLKTVAIAKFTEELKMYQLMFDAHKNLGDNIDTMSVGDLCLALAVTETYVRDDIETFIASAKKTAAKYIMHVKNGSGYMRKTMRWLIQKPNQGTYNNWNKDTYSKKTRYEKARTDLSQAKSLLKKTINAKVEQKENLIKFYPKKKRNVKWLRAKNATTVSQRLYCNCCGAVIPDFHYLKLQSESGGRNVYLCAFCVDALAEQVAGKLSTVDPELKNEYKKEHFLEAL